MYASISHATNIKFCCWEHHVRLGHWRKRPETWESGMTTTEPPEVEINTNGQLSVVWVPEGFAPIVGDHK